MLLRQQGHATRLARARTRAEARSPVTSNAAAAWPAAMIVRKSQRLAGRSTGSCATHVTGSTACAADSFEHLPVAVESDTDWPAPRGAVRAHAQSAAADSQARDAASAGDALIGEW
jgi:hypothetical protein